MDIYGGCYDLIPSSPLGGSYRCYQKFLSVMCFQTSTHCFFEAYIKQFDTCVNGPQCGMVRHLGKCG